MTSSCQVRGTRRDGAVGDTAATVRITHIRLERLRVAAGPAVPGRLGPGPADVVRGDDRPRRDRRGRGRRRIGRHDGRLRGVRARCSSARTRWRSRATSASLETDRLPCRALLAARGGALGHRRPGRRAAGRDAVRRRQRRDPGLRLVRDAPARRSRARRIRATAARRGVPRAEDPRRPAAARRGPRRGHRDARRRSATRWRSWSTSTRAGGWPATRPGRSIPPRPGASPSRLAEHDVLWVEEPLAGTDLRGLSALRAAGPGFRIAGGEMTRTFAETLAALDADAFDVYQPDVVLAAGMLRTRTLAELALARNRWFTPHTWTNGLGLLANLHVAAGVGGGPFIEFPYDPPGWTPERRDAFLAEPIRPGPDGLLRVPARPGLGAIARRGRRSRGTRHEPTASRTPPSADWLARAPPPSARATEPFIDGRFVPPRRAGRSTTSRAATGRSSRTSPRAAPRTSTARSPRPRASFDDRRWADPSPARPQARPAAARRADPREPRRARAARVARRRQADPRHARRRRAVAPPRPSSGTPRPSTRSTARSGRPGRDALSLVTREPLGVVAAIVPVELPADHHRVEARRRRWRPATRVVLKPAAQSPLTALRLAELAIEAGLPDGVLNVVPGPGPVLGEALAPPPRRRQDRLHRLDRGRQVAAPGDRRDRRQGGLARARRQEPAASSSPTSATSTRPPARSASGIFYNSGQTCNAGSRLIVHRSVREELVERIARARPRAGPGRAARPGDPARLDRRRAPARQGARLRRPRARGGRRGRGRRRARARGDRRLLRRPDDPRRRRQRLAGGARGDLRPGPRP